MVSWACLMVSRRCFNGAAGVSGSSQALRIRSAAYFTESTIPVPDVFVDAIKPYFACQVWGLAIPQYLARIKGELKQLQSAGLGQTRKAKSLAQMESTATSGLGHQRLFASGKGLPLRRNQDREFHAGLKRAGIDGAGLCIHSLRYMANSTPLAAGVPERVIRARMGHVTSKMTER